MNREFWTIPRTALLGAIIVGIWEMPLQWSWFAAGYWSVGVALGALVGAIIGKFFLHKKSN